MFTKTVSPVQDGDKLLGTVIQYSIFGVLYYKITLSLPKDGCDFPRFNFNF